MKNTLIQVTQNGMGSNNDELGLLLVSNYFKLINEEDNLPRFIAFYNKGVKLICKGSPIIDDLKKLESKNVKLIACKTCLNYFDILNDIEVGNAGTMIDIVQLQKLADKIINL